jgi:hypothetical protein
MLEIAIASPAACSGFARGKKQSRPPRPVTGRFSPNVAPHDARVRSRLRDAHLLAVRRQSRGSPPRRVKPIKSHCEKNHDTVRSNTHVGIEVQTVFCSQTDVMIRRPGTDPLPEPLFMMRDWAEGTAIGGCSFVIQVRHATRQKLWRREAQFRFSRDSPLEGTRFELLVPLREFATQYAHRTLAREG